MATKKAPPEPKIDWNIWHDAFMEAYDQIDFVTCAKTILYYKSIKWANEGFEYNPDDEEKINDEVINLKSTIQNEAKSAIEEWTKTNNGKKQDMNPFFSGTGFVRVSVWGPEANEEEHKAVVEIIISLEESLH